MAKSKDRKSINGRPPLWNDPKELEKLIDLYFETDAFVVVGSKDDPETGKSVEVKVFAPTMAGLALSIGVDRKTLNNYAHKDEFFPAIKKARQRVEVALEQHLYTKNVTGAIFNLKNNFGWKDKHEIEQQTTHKVDDSLAERLTGGSKR